MNELSLLESLALRSIDDLEEVVIRSSSARLRTVIINDMKSLDSIAIFSQSLDVLRINSCISVRSLHFVCPNLSSLDLISLDSLKDATLENSIALLKNIASLAIQKCPKLKQFVALYFEKLS